MKKKIVALIPSRLESKRLPGKALLDIDGYPIIVHTAKRAMLSKMVDEVYVCTDSIEIIDVCKKNQIQTIKTKKNFKNGTERIASVANKFKNYLIVDVQGDEPLTNPNTIDKLIKFHLKNKYKPEIVIPTRIMSYNSSSTMVRVLSSKSNRIMYLSRANIPYNYKKSVSFVDKHVSVITFSYSGLMKYKKLKESTLESIEDIELLRALENDMKVFSYRIKEKSFSVDINDDYLKAKIAMNEDPYRNKY
ncbi:3-deoxy-manno-octulosonate cytidylyltransferase [Candidatus Pelagibacter bacterium]|nr:3-deoxy-manno-octulosonate cytidylyltransferase [Candidatus Pelagibacter bacterium]